MRQVAKIQSLQDIIAILWRRRWQVIIPAFLLFVASLAVAMTWPETYESKATILIEEPDVSGEFLQSTTPSFADQRVQVISQQVLSSQNLMKLIEKFDLYPDVQDNTQLKSAALSLRDSIWVDFISAEVNDPTMAGRRQATIAFTLSFFHWDPKIAQKVAEELVALYLAENQRTREARASQTTEFLAREAEKLAQQIDELEAKLAAFKQENAGSLPEEASINQQTLYRYELEMLQLRHQMQSQDERKVYIESQLTQVSPYASITLDDGTVLQPDERLKKLESQYSELSYTYGPKHPTMVELATEIESLKATLGVNGQGRSEKPTNPAYIQLQADLKAVKSNLSSLRSTHAELAAKHRALEDQMLKAPDIEREYLLLSRNYENATADYRALKEKLSEAERIEWVESEQKGQHFSVIEPPEVPLEPIAPNRKLLVLVGLMISVVGGLGTATVAEVLDQTISGPRHLAAIAGVAPLVVIPVIRAANSRQRAFGVSLVLIVGLSTLIGGGLLAMNEFVMPVDELWAQFGPSVGAT